MNFKWFTFFILLATFLEVNAQDEFYSYISDRQFRTPESLQGYDFKPEIKETLDGHQTKLSPGQYSFAYLGNYLYINGDGLKGVYSVNNVEPMNYGYKLNLMNARDPSVQGHLKLILNDYAQVEALVIKKKNKDQEIIFHMPNMGKTNRKKEAEYFTDLGEFPVASADSLWEKKMYPFIRIQGNQYRFQSKDSTYFEFIETYKVIDKRKPPKAEKEKGGKGKAEKSKKGKKGKKGEEEVIEEVEEIEEEYDDIEETVTDTVPQLIDLTGMTKEELEEAAAADPKIKLIKEYYIRLKTFEEKEDGTIKPIDTKYKVKGIMERTDDTAKDYEEKYQLDFTIDGGKHIYMFLMADRTASFIEIGETSYLMRGH